MSQDTNVENLIINKLTKAQYESIANPDPTQLYFVTDEVISSSDVTNALGFTPYDATNPEGYISSAAISSLTDVNLTGLADGQVLKYNSTTQKWENSAVGGGATWGNITGTLSDQTDLQNALNSKYDASNPDGYITSADLPTVNNGTLTIQKNGTTVGTFTANDTNNIIANISVPTSISDLTDDTSTYPIDKAESVVDNNSGSLTFWSGTKAQYDAIVTKDANTLYNITDDSNPTLSMLELLYPVGSIYIGTMSACPLQTLGVGTWQLVATDRVLQGAGTRGNVGDKIDESLPNITGQTGGGFRNYGSASSGALYGEYSYNKAPVDGNYTGLANLKFDASRSSSTYQDNAPVQQDAYLVNIWERIS